MPSPPSAIGTSIASQPASRTPHAIAAAAAPCVPLKSFQHTPRPASPREHRAGAGGTARIGVHGEESTAPCEGQNASRDQPGHDRGSRRGICHIDRRSPLVLKTNSVGPRSVFSPQAETVVNGHPLLIYAAHVHDVYPNANGPLGLVPLVPVVALADALGGRAALPVAPVRWPEQRHSPSCCSGTRWSVSPRVHGPRPGHRVHRAHCAGAL